MSQHRSEEGACPTYKKLYFLWYFDDDLGFGLEVMGESEGDQLSKHKFACLVNWSFGFGTEARDLRRAWGDYVAKLSQQNGGKIPTELLGIELNFKPGQGIQGDFVQVKQMLDIRV